MNLLKQLQAAFAAQMASYDAIKAKYPDGTGLTDADATAMEVALKEAGALKLKIEAEQQVEALKAWALAAAATVVPHDGTQKDTPDDSTKEIKAWAEPRKTYGEVKSFQDFDGITKEERAYGFSQFLIAALAKPGNPGAAKAFTFCKERGIEIKAQGETVNADGGVLVPVQFLPDLINLKEKFGVFRQVTRVLPMVRETLEVPRRTAGLAANWAGENTAFTDSKVALDMITMVAKKLYAYNLSPIELNEDAAISMAELVMQEGAYALANKEDLAGFTGDGTSTYGGITGFTNAFLNLSATRANIAGAYVAPTNTKTDWANITAAAFSGFMALLPEYADNPAATFACSKAFYHGVMERLMIAGGGNTIQTLSSGARQRQFLGYPVVVSQALTKIPVTDKVICLFGDFTLASKLGDRRQVTIATSEHVAFNSDQIATKITERLDINIHDIGNQSATAGLRQAGPVVAMLADA